MPTSSSWPLQFHERQVDLTAIPQAQSGRRKRTHTQSGRRKCSSADPSNRSIARRRTTRGAFKLRVTQTIVWEMSLDAVIGRIDQIVACQQALSTLGPPTAASSSASGFAAELSSAQDALASGSTLTASPEIASEALSSSALTSCSPAAVPTSSPAALPTSSPAALPTPSVVADGGENAGAASAERMLAAAQAAVGGAYNQDNHDAVADSAGQIQQLGTDCSGFVSYLMGPKNGIGDWSQSYCTPDIPTAPQIQPGKGTYVTIWNNPNPGDAGHVWIEILGKYFESAGSTGVHQMDQSEVNMYLNTGEYQPFHPAGM